MESDLLNNNNDEFYTSNSKIISQLDNNFSNVTAAKTTQQITGCKKPLTTNPLVSILTGGVSNLTYKKKKKEYDDCIANYKQQQADISNNAKQAHQAEAVKAKADLAQKQSQLNEAKLSNQSDSTNTNREDDREVSDKILGMPKTAFWIGVSVIGLGVAGFITYKIIKR